MKFFSPGLHGGPVNLAQALTNAVCVLASLLYKDKIRIISNSMKITPALKAEMLAEMELFAALPPPALDHVIACAQLHPLSGGSRIFDQGDLAERAYALIDGRVRISQFGSDGEQVVIRFIGPGEMFGTIALFTGHRYPAEAVTLTGSLVVSWSEADLLDLVQHYPGIAINLVRITGHRLKEAQDRIRELSTQRVEQRVAHALLRLASQAGRDTRDGTQIDFALTRKHVGEMSGTTLHMVSRIVTTWEKAGWIVTDRQRITLRNMQEIRRIAEDPTP